MLQATFSFYDEIQISQCPSNFSDLKKKIMDLYILNENQIDNCLISYLDINNNIIYILDEEKFQNTIPIIEYIILRIEISDDDKYFPIESLICDENEIEYFEEDNKIKNNEINEKYKKENKIIHEGIKCNECGCQEIIGIRYLCGVCHDFNLCEKCEKNIGIMHNHPLLKIRYSELSPISFSCKLEDN